MSASTIQFCEDVLTFAKHVKNQLTVLAASHDLTIAQLYVLRSVQKGDTTMGHVACAVQCDASNVTGIIDRLVSQGLVSRRELEKDRRAKVLGLTAKGKLVLGRIMDELPRALGVERLDADDREKLHELLLRMTGDGQHPPASP